ncbi:MAG: hypothetical protein WDO56_13635 [Gammaproteobacteria bacterium]
MNPRVAVRMAAMLAALVGLAGCGSSAGETATVASNGAALTSETYCSVPDLPPSTRHTYLLLDQRALAKAATADSFVAKNAGVRDVLMMFGDPERSTQAGLMDWRERVTLLLIPADGGAARLLFSGCVPSMSPAELAAADKSSSAVSTFFKGGARQALTGEQATFRRYFIAAMLRAASDAPVAATVETGPLAQSALVKALRESGRVISPDSGLPRVVLFANLGRIEIPGVKTLSDARRAGLVDGARSGLDFARSELHVFLVDGPAADVAREYVDLFALAQKAHLVSWGKGPSVVPLAARSVKRYSGTIQYGADVVPVQVRMAMDQDGKLVDSWFVMQGNPDVAIPLSGRLACESSDNCTVRADESGFAQAWRTSSGTAPQFDSSLPFGGARKWQFETRKNTLAGKVYDSGIRFGSDNGQSSLAVKATSAENATF